jgi:HK97 family phage major capsid protein
LSSEEQTSYDAMDADQVSFKARADRMHKAAEIESEIMGNQSTSHRPSVDAVKAKGKFATASYIDGFNAYARLGKARIDGNILNALQVGTDAEGGYIVPTEFDTNLVEVMQDINELRQYVNVISTASDRNNPIESTLGVAPWPAEEAASTKSDAAFGQAVLTAPKLDTIIKVSEELLADSFFDVGGYLARNFGKRFGSAEELAFVAGNGSGKPTGIVTGSGLGVTAAGTAAITGDELIDLFHSLSRPYRRNAIFMLADGTAKLIRKLKNANGDYIWQAGLQAGQPDTLLNKPVLSSTAMPAATTGLKSVVFGDMSNYTVADRQGAILMRLNELYAENGQVGFRMYKRVDGKVIDATGIKHLIQA